MLAMLRKQNQGLVGIPNFSVNRSLNARGLALRLQADEPYGVKSHRGARGKTYDVDLADWHKDRCESGCFDPALD